MSARVTSGCLKWIGSGFLALGIVCGLGSGAALLERARSGRGVMFADVEFLALGGAAFGVVGVLTLVVGVRVGKR